MRKSLWVRVGRVGRKRVIAALVTVILASAGVALPPQVVTAVVTAGEAIGDSFVDG